MRRLSLVCALLAALVVTAALPAGAAPTKTGTPLDLDCGADGTISVLVQFESNAVAVFDLTAGNGRQYVLSELDFRVYAGDLGSEPTEEPLFQEVKTWGKRNGYSETFTCAGSLVLTFPEEGTFTTFFDVVASGK